MPDKQAMIKSYSTRSTVLFGLGLFCTLVCGGLLLGFPLLLAGAIYGTKAQRLQGE
jgi:hypothetical protein